MSRRCVHAFTLLLALAFGLMRMVACIPKHQPLIPPTLGQPSRTLVLILRLDPSSRLVQVEGIVPSRICKADLRRWRLNGLNLVSPGDGGRGQLLWGVTPSIFIEETDPEHYVVRLRKVALAPGETLEVFVPGANVDRFGIAPPPDNLYEVEDPAGDPKGIVYSGSSTTPIDVSIPVTLIHSQIGLTITPLVGKLFTQDSASTRDSPEITSTVPTSVSFRVSGQVTFDAITDYVSFQRYCNPAKSITFDSRRPHLLNQLDYPSSWLNVTANAYLLKPTALHIANEVLSCEYDTETQRVIASFNGAAQPAAAPGTFHGILAQADVREQHSRYPGSDLAGNVNEIQMGEVVLAQGDRLTIVIPEVTVLSVSPSPAVLELSSDGRQRIEYNGPRRFTFVLHYATTPTLVVRQFPSILRSVARALEVRLTPDQDNPAWFSWALVVLGTLAMFGDRITASSQSKHDLSRSEASPGTEAASSRLTKTGSLRHSRTTGPAGSDETPLGHALFAARVIAVLLAMAGLFFLLRNVMGWLLLASLLFARSQYPERVGMRNGVLMAAAVLAGGGVDAWAKRVFETLGFLDPELTPLTPGILGLLAVLPVWLLLCRALGRPNPDLWRADRVFPFVLCFLALSTYDAYQKSLSSLALIALWGLFLTIRYLRINRTLRNDASVFVDTPQMIAQVVGEPWFRLSLLVLTGYASVQGITDTLSLVVVSRELGVLAPLLVPLMQVVSVLLVFVASALLFLLLYTLLPGKEAVFKAVFLAVVLLGVFLVGIGGDERLIPILGQLVVSRFVYYLSAPLLVALVLDLKRIQAERQAKAHGPSAGEGAESIASSGRAELLPRLEKLLSIATGIASIVAPALYANIANHPLITNYFQLMKLLGAF